MTGSAEFQITSFRNPKVKYLRSLQVRKYRQREGRFVIEGIRIVEEALDRNAPLDTLVYAPDLLVSERARALVERVAPEQRLALSGEVFGSISEREQPHGVAAVLRIEELSLTAIPISEGMLVLVAYQLSDPGNLGSIIRTADAAGASGVVVVEPSVDLYDPHTIRATMGSFFALPLVRLDDGAALPAWYEQIRREGLPLLVAATSAHAAIVHFDVDYRRPLVLLLGSERDGLPPEVRDSASVAVRLPMAGRASSLNVSAAAAALVFEVIRQRRLGAVPGPERNV